ncbi:MAG: 4-vinyl reductase [Crocosphaera sp.]
MDLSVEPIFYSSFVNLGFLPLSSSLISQENKQFFLKNIVEKYWDSYNPPEPGYQGVYLLQQSLKETFFGWLYNDENDDFGRSNIPYFICYVFLGELNPYQLNLIWDCLKLGPMTVIYRKEVPEKIDGIIIPKNCNYQPDRLGVTVPNFIQLQTKENLDNNKLINQFFSNDLTKKITQNTFQKSKQSLIPVTSFPSIEQTICMNALNIDKILQDLLIKPIDIQGIALVSQEGQAIINPIGMDEATISIVSGTMLYAVQTTQREFNWQTVETISIRSKDGYLVLAACTEESYLLIKTGKVLTGLLEAEVGRTVKKIQTLLQPSETLVLETKQPPKPLDNTVYLDSQGLEEWGEVIDIEKNDNSETLLFEIAEELIDLYPDFVATVRDMDQNPNINQHQKLKLGEYVGEGLVKQGKVKSVKVKNIVSGIKKLLIPAISDFMIAEGQKNKLIIYANPFCLYKTSNVCSCYFLRGMMKGLLTSVSHLPPFRVEEMSCKATGADNCCFKINPLSDVTES